MKSGKAILMAGLFVIPMVLAAAAFRQEKTPTDQELNLREYVNLLRSDVRAQRVGIITQMMQFDDAEAAAFWPIFREYDAELTKLGDGRMSLIEDYIMNYDNVTDEKADELMTKVFALEAQRAELKKKYFDKMKVAVSAVTAARFFQIENQMQHLIDLQVSENLPTMQRASE